MISGYAQGLNSYAKTHPDKVLYKKLFPITPKMMMMYSQLQLFISNQGADWAGRILNNDTQDDYLDQNLTGSNVIAMNSNKTDNGETFLAINTHQPLEGPTSWYEVHLNSEEGTNIIGTLYPGTPHILIGVNENLGWSHTVNYPDKTDVFKLRMVDNKKYIAALNRFKIVVDEFSITKFTPEALHRMVEAYYEMGMYEDSYNTAALLGYNYPESKWYKYSYNLVQEIDGEETFLKKIRNFF